MPKIKWELKLRNQNHKKELNDAAKRLEIVSASFIDKKGRLHNEDAWLLFWAGSFVPGVLIDGGGS